VGDPDPPAVVAVDTVEIEALKRKIEELTGSEKEKEKEKTRRIEKLSAQFLETQRDLEQQKQARNQEAEATAFKLSHLEQELGKVADNLSGARKIWRWVAVTAGVAATIAACLILWRISVTQILQREAAPAAPIVVHIPRTVTPRPQNRGKLPAEPGAALIASLDRLNAALNQFSDRSPEQVLKAVSNPKEHCMLLWNGNVPSVLFGSPGLPHDPAPGSIAYLLNQCAEAVSNLR
jgi:hypothetical protein